MSRLEEKLIELGYTYDRNVYWIKGKIYLYMSPMKTIIEKWCFIKVNFIIQNRNDIQELHDSIEDYDKQLKIMKKDLEILKGVE